jgi:hypothetical protein
MILTTKREFSEWRSDRFSASKNRGFGSDIENCAKNPERSGRTDISNQVPEFSTVGDAKEGK